MSHKSQLFSGARGIIQYVKAGGGAPVVLAIATDINVNVRAQLRPSYVIGELGPLTIEPLSIDVDCSIGRLVPVNAKGNDADTAADPKKAANSFTTAIDLGLEEKLMDVLSSNSIEIQIMDKGMDPKKPVTIALVKEARFTGRSMSVGTGDVAQERFNFVGIYDGADNNTPVMNGTDTIGYDEKNA